MKRDEWKIGNVGVVAVLVVVGIITLGAIGLLFFDNNGSKNQGWSADKTTLEKTLMMVQAEKAALQAELNKIRVQGMADEGAVAQNKILLKEKKSLENQIALLKKKLSEVESNTFFSDMIREKAELEVRVSQFEEVLNQKDKTIAEIKKKNESLISKLSLGGRSEDILKNQLEEKENVNKLLSKYLADEKRRNKDLGSQLAALNSEKESLSSQLDQLLSEKEYAQKKLNEIALDLESTQKEKRLLTAKLESVQKVINDRLGEIVQVKKDLDTTLQETKAYVQNEIEEIELEPIVVRSETAARKVQPAEPKGMTVQAQTIQQPVQSVQSSSNIARELVGKVLVVNENLNFIVIDKGANQGVEVGMQFDVMDNSGVIADTQVIEVRDNIAAADIQNLKSAQPIKEGDYVRIR